MGQKKLWRSGRERFEGARGRRSNRKRIVLVLAARLAFGIGWNLRGPGTNAVLVGPLERVVGLGDQVRIIQSLALAATVREFTLLAETW